MHGGSEAVKTKLMASASHSLTRVLLMSNLARETEVTKGKWTSLLHIATNVITIILDLLVVISVNLVYYI